MFPALEALLESAVMLEELSDLFLFFLIFFHINGPMEMLTVHRKLRCEHSFTPVSVLKGAGTQLLSLLFMTFIVEHLALR